MQTWRLWSAWSVMILTDNIQYYNNIDSAVDQFEVHFEGICEGWERLMRNGLHSVIRSLNIHVVIKLWAGFQNLWPGRTFVLSVRTNIWKCVNRDQKRRRLQWWEYQGTFGIAKCFWFFSCVSIIHLFSSRLLVGSMMSETWTQGWTLLKAIAIVIWV